MIRERPVSRAAARRNRAFNSGWLRTTALTMSTHASRRPSGNRSNTSFLASSGVPFSWSITRLKNSSVSRTPSAAARPALGTLTSDVQLFIQ